MTTGASSSSPLSDSHPFYPSYQVGGSLREDTASYVVRQADHDLYEGLRSGLFCYVLNSRQMGKSSLRVRTMARLRTEGYACVAFEMRELCVYQVNADEFYGGFVSHLASEFELSIDLEAWWNQQALLHPFLRLGKFIEEILLNRIETNIVIFIDEIDSVLNLEFKDDFFAFLRSCYHKRADKPQFQRLNFACLGVATPMDLIADSSFTPLNLESRAIELMGFQLTEAQPLIEGLRSRAANPEAVMAAILDWTGGQPFLTQWVCQIVQQINQAIPPGTEAHWVEQHVRSQIINHWQTGDRQQHFQTIRDRILNSETLACWALGLYQQLLNQGETAVEDSRDLMQFRLSGLVVKQQGKLRIYNRIYASIFDQAWTEQALRAIRPYGAQLLAWEQSGETRYLLNGEELQWALAWSEELSLSHGDYQFLSASQTQELQLAQHKTGLALEQEQVAIARLIQVERKTRKRLWLGALGLTLAVASALGIAFYFGRATQQLRRNTEILSLEREGTRILQERSDANQLMDLIAALKATQRLRTLSDQYDLPQWPVHTPLFALQAVLGSIHERNRWDLGHSPACLTLSPNGQQIAVGGEDGSISLWNLDGTRIKTLAAYRPQKSLQSPTDTIWPIALSWSTDGRWLASSSTDLTIEIWEIATGKKVRSFDLDHEPVLDLRFTPAGTLVAVNQLGKVGLWSARGSTQWQWLASRSVIDPDPQPTALLSQPGRVGPTSSALPARAEDFALSDEGDAVIFTNPQGQPEVRSVQTGQVIKRYPTIQYRPGELVRHVFRSQDQRYTSITLNRIHFWQTDGSSLAQVQVHPSMVNGFRYSPDGDHLVTIHPDSTLKLWGLNDQKTLVNLPEPSILPRVGRLQLGSRLRSAAAAQTTPSSPNPSSPPTPRPNPPSPDPAPAPFNPTAQIALPKPETPTRISGAMTAQQLQHPNASLSYFVDLDLDPKTQRIAALNLDGELWFYDQNGQPIQTLSSYTSGEIQQFRSGASYGSLRFSPTGSYLILQSLNPRPILQIRTPEGQLLREIPAQFYNLGVQISPDGHQFAIAGSQPDVMELWTPSGQLVKRLDQADILGFNPQSPTLITATSPNATTPRVTLWSTAGERLRDLASEPLDLITTLGASPNGQFMAAGNNGQLMVWSAQGELLYSLNHGASIMAITYSSDGQKFATTGIDQTIKIWRSDGQFLHRIENVPSVITRLQFSPNDQILAAKTIDGNIYIWQTNGELITRLQVGGSLNTILSFSRNGKRLISAGGPRIYSWNLDLNELIDQGCDWLQDYLRQHPQEREKLWICSHR